MTTHSRVIYQAPVVDGPSMMGLTFGLLDNDIREDGKRRKVTFEFDNGDKVKALVEGLHRIPGTESDFVVEAIAVDGPRRGAFDVRMTVVSDET